MKQFDILVFIGRFQPLHNAHCETISKALELAEHTLVLIGSSRIARNVKNPFTFLERKEMIKMCFNNNDKLYISCLNDYLYNENRWLLSVQNEVDELIERLYKRQYVKTLRIGIIGCNKDDSTYYIKSFPKYKIVELDEIKDINATSIREDYIIKDDIYYPENIVNKIPNCIYEFLSKFRTTTDFKQLVNEKEFILNYKKQYSQLEYPPIFVTTDTLVLQSGHILLVKRKAEPGKGLYALPGGFLNANSDKSLEDCAIRELKEETNIKVPIPILRGNIVKHQYFDAIGRSLRGRTITHVFLIQLPDFGDLPKVKGSDDADKAIWLPLNEVRPDIFFEDHYEIIQSLI